ncbi:glycosyltransferase family 2 protein [Nesterenkonia sp. Act20]|uniref:glycosyltransferase family 2 protein n=1 Tax=Nesterenkonia sp. Act20 TaxID=1483432 RepID=UPI001C460DCF|nr:glycosyltransferase family 2 protein [Nesterenkonia sp. Act20]
MTGSPPLVSIIIPVHNSRAHIPALLERLTQQVQDRDEILLVDDASTDDGTPLLEAFVAAHPQARLIRLDSPHGVARARNAALKLAHGQYVWFADDDDLWAPHILDVLLEAATRSDADVVVCQAELRHPGHQSGAIIDGTDHELIISRERAWTLVLEGAMQGYLWNKLIRRSTLGTDPFTDMSSQSDFTGVVRALANSDCVHLIPAVLYFHLVREGSITRRKTPNLANLERAHDLAIELIPGEEATGLTGSMNYFRAWFLVLPLAHTPTRVRAPWSIRRDGLRRAREAAQHLDMVELHVRSRRIHHQVWLVTRLGTVYLLALHAAQVLKRLDRRIRSDARRGA